MFQLGYNLESDDTDSTDQLVEAFCEFYKLFNQYGIINSALYNNVNKASKQILEQRETNQKENIIQNKAVITA